MKQVFELKGTIKVEMDDKCINLIDEFEDPILKTGLAEKFADRMAEMMIFSEGLPPARAITKMLLDGKIDLQHLLMMSQMYLQDQKKQIAVMQSLKRMFQ